MTEPGERLKWLYEEQGQKAELLVSTSCTIPADDTDQPPHRQAANYYKKVASDLDGEYRVTMDHPSATNPKPLVIEIGRSGYKIFKIAGGSAAVIGNAAPRAGHGRG